MYFSQRILFFEIKSLLLHGSDLQLKSTKSVQGIFFFPDAVCIGFPSKEIGIMEPYRGEEELI